MCFLCSMSKHRTSRNASSRERRAAEQEAQLLSQLKHPNIVTYKVVGGVGTVLLYIVMGFCEGGDLYRKLKEQKGGFLPESQVVEWFVPDRHVALQVLLGFRAFHLLQGDRRMAGGILGEMIPQIYL